MIKPSAYTYVAAGTCVPSSTVLCLQYGRFKVETTATSGTIDGTTDTYSEQSGAFWLYQAGNLEILAKMIDGREVNGKFWFYHGGLTSGDYNVMVTDTTSGQIEEYPKLDGNYWSCPDSVDSLRLSFIRPAVGL